MQRMSKSLQELLEIISRQFMRILRRPPSLDCVTIARSLAIGPVSVLTRSPTVLVLTIVTTEEVVDLIDVPTRGHLQLLHKTPTPLLGGARSLLMVLHKMLSAMARLSIGAITASTIQQRMALPLTPVRSQVILKPTVVSLQILLHGMSTSTPSTLTPRRSLVLTLRVFCSCL
jgi:hypothetical protein